MKDEKIIAAANKYEKEIRELIFFNCVARDLRHLEWMTKQIPKFITAGRKEKANRWLGFIQGALWADNIYTIEQMKEHNKPDENK